MPNIDFPASPTTGSVFYGEQNAWVYDGSKWSSFSWGTPHFSSTDGSLNGGNAQSSTHIIVNNGRSTSLFGSATTINGGTA